MLYVIMSMCIVFVELEVISLCLVGDVLEVIFVGVINVMVWRSVNFIVCFFCEVLILFIGGVSYC